MNRDIIIGFLLLMVTDTFMQISIKMAGPSVESLDFTREWIIGVITNPWIYAAILGCLLSGINWISLLKKAPVGSSFAASHLELIPVTLLSCILFGDVLNSYKIIGGLCIIIGVLCLAKGEVNVDLAKK